MGRASCRGGLMLAGLWNEGSPPFFFFVTGMRIVLPGQLRERFIFCHVFCGGRRVHGARTDRLIYPQTKEIRSSEATMQSSVTVLLVNVQSAARRFLTAFV